MEEANSGRPSFPFLSSAALGFLTNQTNRLRGRHDVCFVFNLESDHGEGSTLALSSLHLEPSICCLRSRWCRKRRPYPPALTLMIWWLTHPAGLPVRSQPLCGYIGVVEIRRGLGSRLSISPSQGVASTSKCGLANLVRQGFGVVM
jgi:hypothetical protein